jgi:hypothetical protein
VASRLTSVYSRRRVGCSAAPTPRDSPAAAETRVLAGLRKVMTERIRHSEVDMRDRFCGDRLVRNHAERQHADWWLRQLALVFGGAAVVSAAVFTLRHMSDRAVLLVTIPGFVVGIVLLAVYGALSRRVGGARQA